MVTRVLIALLGCLICGPSFARADAPPLAQRSEGEPQAEKDAQRDPTRDHGPEAQARNLFDRGIQAAERGAWQEAAQSFEESLSLMDRAATRANLVRAYEELERPLGVIRHALAFLSLPYEPHRSEVRKAVQASLDQATRDVAVLTTRSIPPGSELRIDGEPPEWTGTDGRLYLAPGLHTLEVRVPMTEAELIEIQLKGGQVLEWPHQARSSVGEGKPLPLPAAGVEPAALSVLRPAPPGNPPWRRRTAISLALLGLSLEVAAVGAYWATLRRGDAVRQADPAVSGFLDKTARYDRLASAVAPLALVGSLLCASAITMSARAPRWGSRAWAYSAMGAGAVLLSAATVLVVRTPDTFGSTNVEQPTRQAGAVMAGASLPLLAYGVTFELSRRSRTVQAKAP